MWSRLFLTSLCLLSVLAVKPLTAGTMTNTDVQFEMQHAVDSQCDGTPDANAKAIPDSCIIYSITAINTGNRIYQDVVISAHIPKHTKLVQPYRGQNNRQSLSSHTVYNADGVNLIETKLDALLPGENNRISVNYAVKIK